MSGITPGRRKVREADRIAMIRDRRPRKLPRATRWFTVSVVAVLAGGPAHLAEPPPAPGWTRYEDHENGFTVSYPDSWNRSEAVLTSALETPREILTVGTAQLPAGGDTCAQYPGNALEAMRAHDVLVSVQEVKGRLGGRHTIDRPAHFTLALGYQSGATDCLPARFAAYETRLIPFRDGSRSFYAFVAYGPSASDESLSDATGVLDSLDFS
jgi:hypothetical protein